MKVMHTYKFYFGSFVQLTRNKILGFISPLGINSTGPLPMYFCMKDD